jgi:hypothetical protein
MWGSLNYFFMYSQIMDFKLMFLIAQSFSPFSARDGRQVTRPSWIWATSLCYILLNKFVALVGSGRRVRRPSRDKKGLKDWANVFTNHACKTCTNVRELQCESPSYLN